MTNQLKLPKLLQFAANTDNVVNFQQDQILSIQNWILKQIKADPLEFVLRPRQIQGLIEYIINEEDIAVFLPTGYGKTIIALLCAIYEWQINGKKTIYIGMLRALTLEMFETFSKYLPTIIDDGAHRKTIEDYENEEWVISCLTPEKFDLLMLNENKRDVLMEQVGLIITDEAHNIGDRNRGHKMENYLVQCRIANPELRYIFLSATVGNPVEFNEWLESKLIFAEASERPVPLNLKMNAYEENMYHWNENIPDFKANYKTRLALIEDIIEDHGVDQTYLIFCTSKARAESTVADLSGIKRRRGEKDESYLDRLMASNYAYHHAGMPEKYKKMVASGLKDGSIKFCGCTTTLAVGVNVFANICVLFDVEQFDETGDSPDAVPDSKFVPLDANRTQQTGGRAGRPVTKCPKCGGNVIKNVCQKCNWENIGYFYVITPNRLAEKMEYRATTPLEVKSQLKPRLHEKIIQWISAGLVNDILDIVETCEYCYANVTEDEAYNAINWLKTFGFIKEIEGEYAVTWIGLKTAQFGILPESVVSWQAQVCNVSNPNDLMEIFVRFASVDEYYKNTTVRAEDEKMLELSAEMIGDIFPKMSKVCDGRMCLTCTQSKDCIDKSFKVSECSNHVSNIEYTIKDSVKKCFYLNFHKEMEAKIPTILKNRKIYGTWEKYEAPSFKVIVSDSDVRTLRETGNRLLGCAAVIFSGHKRLANSLSLLSKMVLGGTLRKELANLTVLKRIGIKTAEKLVEAGINTKESFMAEDNARLGRIIGNSARVITNIKLLNQ